MDKAERTERIMKASVAVYDAYGYAMDLYVAAHNRLDMAELEIISDIWRRLSRASQELRNLELDAALDK